MESEGGVVRLCDAGDFALIPGLKNLTWGDARKIDTALDRENAVAKVSIRRGVVRVCAVRYKQM